MSCCLHLEILISPVTFHKRTKTTLSTNEKFEGSIITGIPWLTEAAITSSCRSSHSCNPCQLFSNLACSQYCDTQFLWISVDDWDKANNIKCWILKIEILLVCTCQILLMHLIYVQSGKTVKKEVASFEREAVLSISENNPDRELVNKNTLLSKCVLKCTWAFFLCHTQIVFAMFSENKFILMSLVCFLSISTIGRSKILLGDSSKGLPKKPVVKFLYELPFPPLFSMYFSHNGEDSRCYCTQANIVWHTDFLGNMLIFSVLHRSSGRNCTAGGEIITGQKLVGVLDSRRNIGH